MSYLDIALKVADNFNIMSPARRDSLQQVINATAETTVAEIIQIGRWQHSPATRAAEDSAVKIQKGILSGNGKLIDFKEACEKWKKAGIE
jgi:hypothetical protein